MSRTGIVQSALARIDWFLLAAAVAISGAGLMTMRSFLVEQFFFERQAVWIVIAIAAFFVATIPEYGFLRRTSIVTTFFVITISVLGLLYVFGSIVLGAQNRFSLGLLSIQPSDPAKLLLVLLLAKYFARRHIEIAHVRHILVSLAYTGMLLALVFFQPDFGSSIIIASIWFGMVLIAGISWKHLLTLIVIGIIGCAGLWQYGLQPYQKQRVLTFIHPLTDIRGAGYNAYQAMVAVGSGELLGKGIGYGTQSKLQFLPEYQTDFIFAAFAEEWGFVGVLLLFGLFGVVIIRILIIAGRGSDNFDMLFGMGVAVYFCAQFIVHVGMNMGLLPITGTTLPFMSYGGSHLVTEYVALGILMAMRRHERLGIEGRDQTDRFAVHKG